MEINKKYTSCGQVFNVMVNGIKVRSECPFGAFGTVDGIKCTNSNDVCGTCGNYIVRKRNVISIQENNKQGHNDRVMKDIINERNYKKKTKTKSYLYNDVMINSEDKKSFESNLEIKTSKSVKKKNKEEGKTVRITDIY